MMGFRCPKCHKDFGTNKKDLYDHFKEEPECAKGALTVTKKAFGDSVEDVKFKKELSKK